MKEIRTKAKEKALEKFQRQDKAMTMGLWVIAAVIYLRGIYFIYRLSEINVDVEGFSLYFHMVVKILGCLAISIFMLCFLATENEEKKEGFMKLARITLHTIKLGIGMVFCILFHLIKGLIKAMVVAYSEGVAYADERESRFERQEMRRDEWKDFDVTDYYVVEYDEEEEYGPECYLFADPEGDNI